MAARALKVLVGVGVLAGGLAASKRTDAEIVAKVGATAAAKLRAAAPDPAALTAPLAGLRPGSALPVEERVRVRIAADKEMDGAAVEVKVGPAAGEVTLRGLVLTQAQRQRAGSLAEGTVGVAKVANEIAVPE